MAEERMLGAGDIEAKNITPGDFVVILCTDPDDKCALALQGLPGSYVFITKVKKITVKDIVVGGDQDVTIVGHFFYNDTKNITEPMKMKKKTERMKLETWDIVDVYEAEENEELELTEDNIVDIEESVKKILEHDEAEKA